MKIITQGEPPNKRGVPVNNSSDEGTVTHLSSTAMAYIDDLIHVKLEKDSLLGQSCLHQNRLNDIHNFLKKEQGLYNMPHLPVQSD